MALTLEDKKAIVAEVNDVACRALSVVAADYRGLTVTEMTDLRSKARESGVYLRVVRNTLSKIALKDTDFECLSDELKGPLFLAFSEEAPGAAARLLKEFGKGNDKLQVRHISLNGKLLDASSLEAVASLPTKDEAIAKLCYVMKAPVEKLARTLKETHGKLVRTVAAVAEQKKSS